LTETPASPTAPDQDQPRLSFATKLTYGAGYIPDVIMNNVVATLGMAIYSVELGVSAALIGLAISLPRLWEAFTDPLVGQWSDRTRTRWGRRRPFIAVGAILSGILCLALFAPPPFLTEGFSWMPPDWLATKDQQGNPLPENGLFFYFLIASILYFTAYAFYTVPYLALGLGLSKNDQDRTSLFGFRAAANSFTLITIIPCIMPLVNNSWGKYGLSLGGTPLENVRLVGLGLGVLIVVLGLLAAIFCKESELPPVIAKEKAEEVGFFSGVKAALHNKPFLIAVGIIFFTLIGYCLDMYFIYFIDLAIVFPGDSTPGLSPEAIAASLAKTKADASELMFYGTVIGNILGLFAALFVGRVVTRFGRKPVLLTSQCLMVLAFLASPLLFNPKMPELQILFSALIQTCIACTWVLTLPMLADACDYDEIKHGTRREGIFTALWNWAIKLALAVFPTIFGFLVAHSGFNGKLHVQSPETIQFLRTAFVLAPMIPFLICMYLTIKFPLSPEIIRRMRQEKA
jgi:GPH family glycoside/pentoside/hexuronide:cation symporter